jgi:hypothetical protein
MASNGRWIGPGPGGPYLLRERTSPQGLALGSGCCLRSLAVSVPWRQPTRLCPCLRLCGPASCGAMETGSTFGCIIWVQGSEGIRSLVQKKLQHFCGLLKRWQAGTDRARQPGSAGAPCISAFESSTGKGHRGFRLQSTRSLCAGLVSLKAAFEECLLSAGVGLGRTRVPHSDHSH